MTKKSLITDKITEICKQNILAGMNHSACARAIRVSQQTWWNWQNLGKEGRPPYAKWYIEIQEAESSLLLECLESVRLSMQQGNIETTKWMLERRFSADGFGKASTVNVNAKTENKNLNLNIGAATEDEREKIRQSILEKLAPRSRVISPIAD